MKKKHTAVGVGMKEKEYAPQERLVYPWWAVERAYCEATGRERPPVSPKDMRRFGREVLRADTGRILPRHYIDLPPEVFDRLAQRPDVSTYRRQSVTDRVWAVTGVIIEYVQRQHEAEAVEPVIFLAHRQRTRRNRAQHARTAAAAIFGFGMPAILGVGAITATNNVVEACQEARAEQRFCSPDDVLPVLVPTPAQVGQTVRKLSEMPTPFSR